MNDWEWDICTCGSFWRWWLQHHAVVVIVIVVLCAVGYSFPLSDHLLFDLQISHLTFINIELFFLLKFWFLNMDGIPSSESFGKGQQNRSHFRHPTWASFYSHMSKVVSLCHHCTRGAVTAECHLVGVGRILGVEVKVKLALFSCITLVW